MSSFRFIVPPTNDQGSYVGSCVDCSLFGYRKHALREYNAVRAHDGQPPIQRMPAGTVYESSIKAAMRDAALEMASYRC